MINLNADPLLNLAKVWSESLRYTFDPLTPAEHAANIEHLADQLTRIAARVRIEPSLENGPSGPNWLRCEFD